MTIAALAVPATFYGDGKLNPRPHVRVLRETDRASFLDGDRNGGGL